MSGGWPAHCQSVTLPDTPPPLRHSGPRAGIHPGRATGGPSSPGVASPPLTYKYIRSILDLKSRHQPNLPKEEPKTQGSPPDPSEDSTSWPIPTALAQARGSSKRRHLLIPTGSRAPSLTPRRWKDALDRAIADRPYPAETPSRGSVSSELTLYQARGGGPAIPGRDSLSEVGLPASLRHIKQGAVGPLGPSGGPRK